MVYAEQTKVPIDQSINEIKRTVARYGGDQFLYGVMDERIVVGFSKEGRQVRFQVALEQKDAQRNRQRARALLLVLKAKLEAVESGVAIFEDEFLANIVLPDGKLVAQHVKPHLITAYGTGTTPQLLPDYTA